MIRPFVATDKEALAALFARIAADGSAAHYRPHPMTAAKAEWLAAYAGPDVYLGAWVGEALAGYGMLRGWEAGYAVPSLGIYILPEHRGTGLAKRLMTRLEHEGLARAAEMIRLRVRAENTRAKHLYDSCGFLFDGTVERGELLGIKALSGATA
jgi:ribosomal-protein-alanine N-acetyltransferase